MSNFSWQTEEEAGWDDPAPQPKSPPRRNFPWQWLLVFCAAASLIIVIVYARLQQQVKTATAQAKQDVLAAHQLSQNAAATGDLDLFRTNLSRRDPEWADTQRQLITEGLFLDRSAFGLRWWGDAEITLTDAAATPTLPITITLSPDFLAAEVIYEQEYLLTEGSTISQTVRLQQTAIYRRGGGRWLRADPLDDFWGELETINRQYITLQFNARDEAIATRLAADLNQQLDTLCETFSTFSCNGFTLRVLLTRNPNRFFTLLDLEEIITIDEGRRLSLPSPTLVGLPLDEAGYEAILHGYARPVLALAVTRLTGYECCERGLLFRAFLEKVLSRLNVQPWLLTAEMYDQLQMETLPDPATQLWRLATLETRITGNHLSVYAFVDFLTEQYAPEVDVLQWQAALANTPDYWEWLQSVAGPVEDQLVFNTQWMGFISQQVQPQLPPLALPAGKVQLSCTTNTWQTTLYEYRPQRNEWHAVSLSSNLLEPMGDGYIYEDFTGRGRTLFFVQGDKTAVITTTPTLGTSFTLSYPFLQLLNGHLPENQFHFVSYNPNSSENAQNWLVNLDECANGVCEPRAVSGIPIWSPDEQHVLFYNETFNGDTLTNIELADSNGQVIATAGFGQYPIWLDNSHYAYFSYDLADMLVDVQPEILTSDLYIGSISGEPPQPAFTYADLQNLIPTIGDEQHYLMFFGQARPGDHREISVLVFPWNEFTGEPHVYVITLQWDEGWQELTARYLAWDSLSVVIPTYSPDGQFELFINADDTDSGVILTIRNLTTGAEQAVRDLTTDAFFFSFPVWSEDGRWLMYTTGDELLFVAPQEGYEWRVPYAFSECNQTYYTP